MEREKPTGLTQSKVFEITAKRSIEGAVNCARMSNSLVVLEPYATRSGNKEAAELSVEKRKLFGRIVWDYLELPVGHEEFSKKLLREVEYSPDTEILKPQKKRLRVFKTFDPGVLLRELLFTDGRKKFEISARAPTRKIAVDSKRARI